VTARPPEASRRGIYRAAARDGTRRTSGRMGTA
jgi:hypothetical protein